MQPDLLGREALETGAALICFPQDRNIGKARRVAATYLRRRTDLSRETYWRDTCETLADMMRRRGFDEAEIERQIVAFRRAVSAELSGGDRQRPGGAR